MSDYAPFHTTRMGARFFDTTVPTLVGELVKLNANLERVAQALEWSLRRGRRSAPAPAAPATETP